MEQKIRVKKCPICNDTGVAKYFDFSKHAGLPNGAYLLNGLIDKYGTMSSFLPLE